MIGGAGRAVRRRLYPYVLREIGDRLASYCAATDTTESAVVEAALRQYLDKTSDASLLLRRMDRLGRAVERLQRDLDLQSEAFAAFVQLWFAHTPPVAPEARKAAQAAAEERYEKFVNYVASQFSSGHRFLDDLARETLADEGDLAAVAENGDEGQTRANHGE
jgi:hypothetical protein